MKEAAEGPARDRIEYALARLQQDSLHPLEVPGLIAMLKRSAEELIAAQFIPTSRFDVALEGASLATLGMSKVLPTGMRLLRTLQSEKSVVQALSSFTNRTSARVGLRGAEHAGGKVAHLASPSGFGAKFKKSVGFADDFGAPLEFRATYDPHKPGFTVVETPTHSVIGGIYDSHAIRGFYESTHMGPVTSTTVPSALAKNVKLAGQRHPVSGIVFDRKGFPIFDDVAVFDTRISRSVASKKDAYKHKSSATKILWKEITDGNISRNKFTQKQLRDIERGLEKITGFTWHHHQDIGRMQLIPQTTHTSTGHVGGMKMWKFKEKKSVRE